MPTDAKKRRWIADQLTKSQFFHTKLHEWDLLEIAYELESIKGEELDWNLEDLSVTVKAWNKVIHKGIKPVRVFSHPEVLKQNAKRVSYYRTFAMVSQKSMGNVGLSVNRFEEGQSDIDDDKALEISKHLNRIISTTIEHDEIIDTREFDLWRGMCAGSTAQGSWGNAKGAMAEEVVKDLIGRRVKDRGLVLEEISHGKSKMLELSDGRTLTLTAEPDVWICKSDKVTQVAVEIKGGIDPAAVLERFGASLKSLRRAKQENDSAITILMMQGVSLTSRAREEIENSKSTIDYFFKVEDVISDDDVRKNLFAVMMI